MNERQYCVYKEVLGRKRAQYFFVELNSGAVLIEVGGENTFIKEVVKKVYDRYIFPHVPTIEPGNIYNGNEPREYEPLEDRLFTRIKQRILKRLEMK